MIADGFTKPLQRVAFEKFKGLLGFDIKGSQYLFNRPGQVNQDRQSQLLDETKPEEGDS